MTNSNVGRHGSSGEQQCSPHRNESANRLAQREIEADVGRKQERKTLFP